MTGTSSTAGQRYLAAAQASVARLVDAEWPAIDAAAALLADALAAGHALHGFGTGHSHMLAEELFHRAGGLVRMQPILFDGVTLHGGAELATHLERLPGLAAAIIADHPMAPGDVCLIASNSGGNAVITEFATLARSAACARSASPTCATRRARRPATRVAPGSISWWTWPSTGAWWVMRRSRSRGSRGRSGPRPPWPAPRS